jgi:hypothetical protein
MAVVGVGQCARDTLAVGRQQGQIFRLDIRLKHEAREPPGNLPDPDVIAQGVVQGVVWGQN